MKRSTSSYNYERKLLTIPPNFFVLRHEGFKILNPEGLWVFAKATWILHVWGPQQLLIPAWKLSPLNQETLILAFCKFCWEPENHVWTNISIIVKSCVHNANLKCQETQQKLLPGSQAVSMSSGSRRWHSRIAIANIPSERWDLNIQAWSMS